MKVVQAIAEVLRREGVENLFAYPINPIIEACAELDIKPIIVRQERVGIHMADAVSRLSSGRNVGVFACQSGPGAENSFSGIAQAYAESVPLVFLPMGPARSHSDYFPNFNSSLNYHHVTKSRETLTDPAAVWDAMRRAFSQARNGRPGPVMVEVPADVANLEVEPYDYRPAATLRSAPDPGAIDPVVEALVNAERPVIYAGQGVHYAQAWQELLELAELLEIPVATSLDGKSAFPETHSLSLGSGGAANPAPVHHHIKDADVILGIGCSFADTPFGIRFPKDREVYHATLDAADVNKDLPARGAIIGDARLTLTALLSAASERMGGRPRGRLEAVASKITRQREEWLAEWMPKLASNQSPLNPYRVIWDLMHTISVPDSVITHDAGSPRDQLSPFWQTTSPLSYIGWGKSTQLGYGLGLAMGAKIAEPEKLCINIWGDAAIGMTGMDLETAVRNNIPIMSILFNNFSMAMEIPAMPHSTAKFDSTAISGNYTDFARALGAYAERITEPQDVIPAIERGVQATQDGRTVLLEFITQQEIQYSLRSAEN
jgi:acetolactate synthase-1/2/3 large subunit